MNIELKSKSTPSLLSLGGNLSGTLEPPSTNGKWRGKATATAQGLPALIPDNQSKSVLNIHPIHLTANLQQRTVDVISINDLLGLACVSADACAALAKFALSSPAGFALAAMSNQVQICYSASAYSLACDGHDFQCNDGECIPPSWECDKSEDCTDGEDEHSTCHLKTCPPEEYQCNGGSRCIDTSWVCDRELDCPTGDDEAGCEELQKQLTSTSQTPANNHTISKVLSLQDYNQTESPQPHTQTPDSNHTSTTSEYLAIAGGSAAAVVTTLVIYKAAPPDKECGSELPSTLPSGRIMV